MIDNNGKKHDELGKFATNSSTAAENKRADELTGAAINDKVSKNAKTQNELFGVEYKKYKGIDAVEKLLAEKQGYVKAAFNRPEIGEVDLIWGDSSAGIAHMIERREKQNIDGLALVRLLPEIMNKGKFVYDHNRERFNIEHNGNRVVIKPTYDGKKVTWLMTAMEIKKPLEN